MAVQPSENRAAQTVFEAFKRQLVQNLYEMTLDELKPKIKAAAEAAIKDMEPEIRVITRDMSREITFQILFKGNDPDGPQTSTRR